MGLAFAQPRKAFARFELSAGIRRQERNLIVLDSREEAYAMQTSHFD
jgi:hypothetical protein